MNQPLITVILPVYNSERYIAKALDSVFDQTYRPLDVVVINDGSTDKTASVVSQYQQGELPLRYFYQPNAGPAASRNRGVALAQGDLFAFLDADDWWHPEKLKRQVTLLAQQPALGYVLSHMHVQQEADTPWPTALNQAHYQNDPPCVLPSALLVRREIFQQIGEFDAHYRYCDDTDWFLRAKDAGVPMAIVPEPLVYKRIHATNLSHTPAMTQETLRAVCASVQRRRSPMKAVVQPA